MTFGVSHNAFEETGDANKFVVRVHKFAAGTNLAATTTDLQASKLHEEAPSQPDQGSGGQVKHWSMAAEEIESRR